MFSDAISYLKYSAPLGGEEMIQPFPLFYAPRKRTKKPK